MPLPLDQSEKALLSQEIVACASLPVQALATFTMLWAWQMASMAQLAALAFVPWRGPLDYAGAAAGDLDKTATKSIFDAAFSLGAIGELRPFPE
jgi:hypothetical protein